MRWSYLMWSDLLPARAAAADRNSRTKCITTAALLIILLLMPALSIADNRITPPPKVDLLACPDDTLVTTEQNSHVEPDGDDYAACRKDPVDPRHAIVALAHYADKDQADEKSLQMMGVHGFDLRVDVMIVDIASGNILISRHNADDFERTGAFVKMEIDTARYDLAPGQRAFGIRVKQHEGCGEGCEVTSTQLALYLRRGAALQKLLHTWVGEHEDGVGPDGKGYSAHRFVTVLCMDGQRSHGLANIWSVQRRVFTDDPNGNVDIDAGRIPCGAMAPERMLWRYNGKQYAEETHGS